MTDKPIRVEPDYPEKRAVDLRRRDTSDISLEDVAHDAKRRAERRPKELAAFAAAIAVVIGALAAGAVKVIGAFKDHSDRGDLIEYRLGKNEGDVSELRGKVDHARLRLERCHCPVGD